MSLAYWVSKFSRELLTVELFLISCLATTYFSYLLIQKRRYGVAKKNIPDNVVRAFLVELISNAEGFKNQLFGEDFKVPKTATVTRVVEVEPSRVAPEAGTSATTIDTAETDRLRKELAHAKQNEKDLNETINRLNTEKKELLNKLKAAEQAIKEGGGSEAVVTEMKQKVDQLQAMLAEYEVIEDDLANLKRFQQENKLLREQIISLGAEPVVTETGPASPASDNAEATLEADESTELEQAAEETLEAMAAEDTKPEAGKPAASTPKKSEPKLATVTELKPKEVKVEKEEASTSGSSEKSDADLLQEFEKMLNG